MSEIEKVINEDGEIRLLVDPLTHDVRSKKQVVYWRKRAYHKEKVRGKNWVACYHEPIKKIIEEKKLELHELGALLLLITYLQFNKDGLLIVENEPMTIDDIGIIIRKKRRQTQTIVSKLTSVGIINNIGNNRNPKYVINQEYHSIGEIGDGMFTQLYQVKTREKASEISLQDAGLLYKILPWFHYQKCYLCSNPNEMNPEEIHHLNHTELSELIGEDEKIVRRHMNSLINKGFIMKRVSYGAVNYIVNPNIMYGQEGSSDYINSLRDEFNELEKTALINCLNT